MSKVPKSLTTLERTWMQLETVRRHIFRSRPVRHICQFGGFSPPTIRLPIFLIGTVRSGTTLFAECLGRHPSVVYAGFELSEEWTRFAKIDIAGPGLGSASCPPLDKIHATENRRIEVHHGFGRVLQRHGGWGHNRLLNKNPHLWNKLPFLYALFPDAQIVVTSRDLYSTVASTKLLWEKMKRDWNVHHYLPTDVEYCWGCIPPASPQDVHPHQLFPGGSVSVLAEYWLRTHEKIDQDAPQFNKVILIKHQDFLADPYGVLLSAQLSLGLTPFGFSLPVKLDRQRNKRWQELLTADEQRDLNDFVEKNRSRIEQLQYADTTL